MPKGVHNGRRGRLKDLPCSLCGTLGQVFLKGDTSEPCPKCCGIGFVRNHGNQKFTRKAMEYHRRYRAP